jgi:hypothetical protein
VVKSSAALNVCPGYGGRRQRGGGGGWGGASPRLLKNFLLILSVCELECPKECRQTRRLGVGPGWDGLADCFGQSAVIMMV